MKKSTKKVKPKKVAPKKVKSKVTKVTKVTKEKVPTEVKANTNHKFYPYKPRKIDTVPPPK